MNTLVKHVIFILALLTGVRAWRVPVARGDDGLTCRVLCCTSGRYGKVLLVTQYDQTTSRYYLNVHTLSAGATSDLVYSDLLDDELHHRGLCDGGLMYHELCDKLREYGSLIPRQFLRALRLDASGRNAKQSAEVTLDKPAAPHHTPELRAHHALEF